MSKVSNQTKDEIISVLQSPDAYVERTSYDEYCGKKTICYKVYSVKYQWLCDLMISPARFGLVEYSLSHRNNQRTVQYIRKNAFLVAPWAKNMVDIHNEICLRYTIQKSQTKTK